MNLKLLIPHLIRVSLVSFELKLKKLCDFTCDEKENIDTNRNSNSLKFQQRKLKSFNANRKSTTDKYRGLVMLIYERSNSKRHQRLSSFPNMIASHCADNRSSRDLFYTHRQIWKNTSRTNRSFSFTSWSSSPWEIILRRQ